jgi:hypothetical protein
MADAPSSETLESLFKSLPREKDMPELITRRVRLVTTEGRTIFAFVRAGQGPLAFAGWEATADRVGEELSMTYFVLGAEKPGDPLQVIGREGPLGVVSTAALEERPE